MARTSSLFLSLLIILSLSKNQMNADMFIYLEKENMYVIITFLPEACAPNNWLWPRRPGQSLKTTKNFILLSYCCITSCHTYFPISQ